MLLWVFRFHMHFVYLVFYVVFVAFKKICFKLAWVLAWTDDVLQSKLKTARLHSSQLP